MRPAAPERSVATRHKDATKGLDSFFSPLFMFDPMSDLVGPPPPASDTTGAPGFGGAQQGGARREYGKEIHSITIHAKQRTFYIDLKESGNGKFFKISEKSRGGRKTTIMFDAEDLDAFLNALNEMKGKL